MDKLSRPYKIALGALVVLALAWFTVLKPSGPADAEVASVPGATGLSNAVKSAEGAAATSNANGAALQAASASPAGAPATPAAILAGATAKPAAPASGATGATGAKKAADRPDPSAPILRDVARGKVAIVLFFSRQAADDRAVRRALASTDRHRGRVVVRAVPIGRVAEYAAISEGVDVLQAPTLLVIGRGNRARSIVGYTDTRSIDQLVADVGGPAFAPRRFKGYKGSIENVCAVAAQRTADAALGAPGTGALFVNLREDVVDARRTVRRLDPPRRYATFHGRYEDNLDLAVDSLDAALRAQRGGKDPMAAFVAFTPRFVASETKLDAAAKRVGLPTSC